MLEAEKTMNVFKRYLQKPYLVVSDSKDLKTCPSAHTFSGYIYIYIYIYIYKLIQVASCYQIYPECGISVNRHVQ